MGGNAAKGSVRHALRDGQEAHGESGQDVLGKGVVGEGGEEVFHFFAGGIIACVGTVHSLWGNCHSHMMMFDKDTFDGR